MVGGEGGASENLQRFGILEGYYKLQWRDEIPKFVVIGFDGGFFCGSFASACPKVT